MVDNLLYLLSVSDNMSKRFCMLLLEYELSPVLLPTSCQTSRGYVKLKII